MVTPVNPSSLQRLIVVGTSGSGKTTYGQKLASVLDLDFIELDGLHWEPDWKPKEERAFRRAVEKAVSADRWVIDGNYSRVRNKLWSRATHVVWLDLTFLRVMYQLFLRTIRRSIQREELYAGNQESLVKAFFSRDSILLWGLSTYHRRRREYREIIRQGSYGHLEYIVLQSTQEMEGWLQQLKDFSANED